MEIELGAMKDTTQPDSIDDPIQTPTQTISRETILGFALIIVIDLVVIFYYNQDPKIEIITLVQHQNVTVYSNVSHIEYLSCPRIKVVEPIDFSKIMEDEKQFENFQYNSNYIGNSFFQNRFRINFRLVRGNFSTFMNYKPYSNYTPEGPKIGIIVTYSNTLEQYLPHFLFRMVKIFKIRIFFEIRL